MSSSTPNQNKNAGNRGDVWKHRTLLGIANLLLDSHDPSKPFRYVETHSGRGVYDLAESKGAQDGILAVSNALPDDPYVLAEASEVQRGRYLGSWKLLAHLLSTRAVAGHLHLCDTDEGVLQAARNNADRTPPIRVPPS